MLTLLIIVDVDEVFTLGTVHVLALLILPTTLGGRGNYHPHLTGEETERQR